MINDVKVELRPAYQWTCDSCGSDNFESCVVAEFSDEDRIEQAKRMGVIEEWEENVPDMLDGEFVTYPDNVKCKSCSTEYATQHMSEDDGE